MIGLEGLQLFTTINSSEGEDFYAPMIKSFGYFCKPQATPPEGDFQDYTFLTIDLLQNSSNLDKNFQYQAVYIEGVINPFRSDSPVTNVPFTHTTKIIYNESIIIGPPLEDYSYIGWGVDALFGIDYPLAQPIEASLDSTTQELSFTSRLTWFSPGPQLEPQYKISGRYYLI